jgi:hypothetical protein
MIRSLLSAALCLAALSIVAVGCGRAEQAEQTAPPSEPQGKEAPSDDKGEEAKEGKPSMDTPTDPKPAGATGTDTPGLGAGSTGMGATGTGAGAGAGAPPSQPPGLTPPSLDPAEKAKDDKAKDGAAYREDFGVEGKADEDAERKEASGGEAVEDDKTSPPVLKRKMKTGEAGYREDFGVEARDKQPPQIANPPKNPKLGEPPKNKP